MHASEVTIIMSMPFASTLPNLTLPSNLIPLSSRKERKYVRRLALPCLASPFLERFIKVQATLYVNQSLYDYSISFDPVDWLASSGIDPVD